MIRRGDVVWVDLDPVRGSEARSRRPAVVVSNDGANGAASTLGRGVVTVVPITSNTTRVLAFQVFLPAGTCGLLRDSKAQAEQVRSISVDRIGEMIGRLTDEAEGALDDALRLHLSL